MNQTLYTFKANLQDLIKLQKEIKKAQIELSKLKRTDKEYQAQQKKIKNLQGNFNKTAGAMKNATGAATGLNKAGGKLINTFKSAAVAIAAAFAVRAIVGSIKAVISTFSEFEAQMAAVKAISGATGDEFTQLEEKALKLGATTVFTATEVGKLQEEFARLGFTVEEIDAATISTLNLAAATGESLSTSAQVAGSTLRAFNLDAGQTQRVTDVMAESFTNSALNLERFKESMKFVAPVARSTGFTIEETSSLLMNLADNGLSGSIAGNALKNVFLKLGDANSKLAKKIGGPVQGLPQLVEAMKKLKEEGFSATEAVDLLDKRSAPAFLALIKNIDGLEDSVDILNMTEGAVNRMAAIRLDTLQGDFTILKSATEGLNIALGEQFDTSLRNVIYRITKFIQSITQSEGALKAIQRTVQFLGAALVGLTARFAGLGIAAFVKGIIGAGRAMITLTQATVGATGATKGLKAAMASTPWGFILQAVTTLAASFFLMGEEADEAAMKTERMTDALNDQLDSILDMGDGTKERGDAMRQLVNDFPELLRFLDLELATNQQLRELRKLMGKEDILAMQDTIKANKEKNADILAERKRAMKKLEELGEYRSGISDDDIRHNNQITRLRDRNKVIQGQIIANNKANDEILKGIENYLADLKTVDNLIIDEGDTYRMALRLQYLGELNDFREFDEARQKSFLESQQSRLEYVTTAVQYNDMIGESIAKFGKVTPQVQEQLDKFLEGTDFGDKLKKDGQSAEEFLVELSELKKFVSNLEAAFIRTGKAGDDFGAKVGFALNKTKDQFKKLSKLLDDLVDNQFDAAIKASENQRNAALEANDEQIALMRANITNISSVRKDADKVELASLIKTNKSKYNAIKTLTKEQYEDAIDGENGNKQAMLLILQQMLDEEGQKLETAFDFQNQLYVSHNAELARIQSERELSNAQDVADAGEQEVRALERNELKFFAAMQRRKDIRENLAKAQIKNVEDIQRQELQNLQTMLDDGLISQAAFERAKIELARKSETEIKKIRQDANDANVQDQLATINKIAEYYNMAFSAFSTFFSNKMALEKQQLEVQYTQQSDDLQTSLERELDLTEGNAEAQEDIRERYRLLQEENELKKAEAIRKVKKKEFQVNKANDIVQAIINGALAMTKVSAQTGVGTFVFSPIIAGLVAAQIAAIAAQKFVGEKGGIIPKFGDGGMVVGPSHDEGGVKFGLNGQVVELEGGEAVINKKSTAMFRSELSNMNVAGGGVAFANGGIMPGTSNTLQASSVNNQQIQFDDLASNIISGINSKEVTVTEASITSSQQNVNVSELTSTIF